VTASLRVIFFGTPAFAVPTLEALLGSSHTLVAVVTQPDKPRHRGQHVSGSPVKIVADAAGVPVWQPDRLKDPAFLERVSALAPDAGVVAAYGRILPAPLLTIPRLGLLNVHASLLPRHRGAAPVHRAIMAGDRETGITIMHIVEALDAGPMLAAVTRAIGPDETSVEVERDLARIGADLLVRTLDRVAAGRARPVEQDESAATYAPRITKADGVIDWGRTASALHNQVRGLHPWPHASASLDDRRIIVLRTALYPDGADAAGQAAGTILPVARGRLLVAAGENTVLEILTLQLAGGRPMPAHAFLAGHPLPAGARFAGPPAA